MSPRNTIARNDENDLEHALHDGNMITIGPSTGEDDKAFDSAIPAELELPYFQFNSPIGIDFTKCISPDIYILCSEILERLSELPNITQELRYHVENLKNFLIFGKMVEFLTELRSMDLKCGFMITDKNQAFDSNFFQIVLNSFGFIIQTLSNTPSNLEKNEESILSTATSSVKAKKWVDQSKLMQYLTNSEDSKLLFKEIRNEINYPSDLVFKSVIYHIFFRIIITHLPLIESVSFWNDIKALISHEDFNQIELLIKPRLTIQPKFSGSSREITDAPKKGSGKEKLLKIHDNDKFIQDTLVFIKFLVNENS